MPENLHFFPYTRRGLWKLFLAAVFPVHLWAIIIMLADVGWVAERTNAWDAVGYSAYVLGIALVESLALFIAIALLGLLLPRQWSQERKLAVLGGYLLVIFLAIVVNQLNFFPIDSFTSWTQDQILGGDHPYRYGILILLAAAGGTGAGAILPVWGGYRSEKYVEIFGDIIERIGLLSSLYLFLDLASLVIIIGRNWM